MTVTDPDGADVPAEEPAGAPATDAAAVSPTAAAPATSPDTTTTDRDDATPHTTTPPPAPRAGIPADAIDRHALPQGRLGIDEVTPEVSGGRFPSKAVVGEVVPVEATVWREGHDAVAATAGLAALRRTEPRARTPTPRSRAATRPRGARAWCRRAR